MENMSLQQSWLFVLLKLLTRAEALCYFYSLLTPDVLFGAAVSFERPKPGQSWQLSSPQAVFPHAT